MEPSFTLPIYVTCTVLEQSRLTPGERRAIIDLCSLAFDEAYEAYWPALERAVFVQLHAGGRLVATGCWVTRALQQADRPLLHTAYVEGVAVAPDLQQRGYGSAVMAVVAQQVWDYELAALSTGVPEFYARLGWEPWLGPTYVRTTAGLVEMPDEGIMVRRTGRTPAWLDRSAPLSCEWRDAPEIW
jgi:GNAT superfamily N-acetyltransferase